MKTVVAIKNSLSGSWALFGSSGSIIGRGETSRGGYKLYSSGRWAYLGTRKTLSDGKTGIDFDPHLLNIITEENNGASPDYVEMDGGTELRVESLLQYVRSFVLDNGLPPRSRYFNGSMCPVVERYHDRTGIRFQDFFPVFEYD